MKQATETVTIRKGQVWRERDPRGTRFVKVIMLLRPKGLRVRTCDINGDFTRGGRETEVNQDRFPKAFDLVR